MYRSFTCISTNYEYLHCLTQCMHPFTHISKNRYIRLQAYWILDSQSVCTLPYDNLLRSEMTVSPEWMHRLSSNQFCLRLPSPNSTRQHQNFKFLLIKLFESYDRPRTEDAQCLTVKIGGFFHKNKTLRRKFRYYTIKLSQISAVSNQKQRNMLQAMLCVGKYLVAI